MEAQTCGLVGNAQAGPRGGYDSQTDNSTIKTSTDTISELQKRSQLRPYSEKGEGGRRVWKVSSTFSRSLCCMPTAPKVELLG